MQEKFAILILEMMKESRSKYRSEIGRLGGLARVGKYGNPGTTAGRSLGGRNAIKALSKINTAFKTEKVVVVKRNIFLAEFMGILFGDGHVGKYQTSITLDSQTDAEYIDFIVANIQKHFKITPGTRKRKGARAIEICISSVSFSKHMVRYGMKEGNKIKKGFRIPNWIFESKVYLKVFIRGLFDTDGTVYMDRKVVGGKQYMYSGIAITSASVELRADIMRALQLLGFSPTCTEKQNSVFLRTRKDVKSYFSIVSSHNPKHCVRYEMFEKEMWQSG